MTACAVLCPFSHGILVHLDLIEKPKLFGGVILKRGHPGPFGIRQPHLCGENVGFILQVFQTTIHAAQLLIDPVKACANRLWLAIHQLIYGFDQCFLVRPLHLTSLECHTRLRFCRGHCCVILIAFWQSFNAASGFGRGKRTVNPYSLLIWLRHSRELLRMPLEVTASRFFQIKK